MNMNIKSSQRVISKVSHNSLAYDILEILALISLGALGVIMHAKLRIPMGIPGKWGLVYMALLVGGRLLSKKQYASSLLSIGAGFMFFIPVLGYYDPLLPLSYLLPGIILDLGYYLISKKHPSFIMLAVVCGISYLSIHLFRYTIFEIGFSTGILSYPYHSALKNGFIFPLITHFLFGLSGGVIGYGAIKLFKKK